MSSLRNGLKIYRSGQTAPNALIATRWPGCSQRKWQSTKQARASHGTNQNGAAFDSLMSTLEKQYAEPFLEPVEPFPVQDVPQPRSKRRRAPPPHIVTAKPPPKYKEPGVPLDPGHKSTRVAKSKTSPNTPRMPKVESSSVEAPERVWPSYLDDQIHIKIGNSEPLYDPLFLRDSCTCPKCVDPSTRQKLFSTADISAKIRVKELWYEDYVVKMSWENDLPGHDQSHVTSLSYKFLARSKAKSPVSEYRLGKFFWKAKQFENVQTVFDYNEYMSQDSVLLAALHQLHRYGLVFVKNVPEAEVSVSDIALRIGPLKNTFYGSTWDVRSVAEAKNVAYTSQDLGFHMDLLYMHQPPRLQLLHCLKASTAGGTSLFSDSYLAANTLFNENKRAFDALTDNDCNFHYDNDSQRYHQSRRVIQVTPGPRLSATGVGATISGRLEAVNWSPPFQGPFHNSGGDFPLAAHIRRWHKAAQTFRDLVESEKAVYQRQMPPGECVIFDNRRVLHARTAFSGGERWLRGCYIDSDPYLSKLRVLERQYGPADSSKSR